jgi:hypothetical protein
MPRPGEGADSADRGNLEDVSRALAAQVGKRRLGHPQRAEQVRLDLVPRLLLGDLLDQAEQAVARCSPPRGDTQTSRLPHEPQFFGDVRRCPRGLALDPTGGRGVSLQPRRRMRLSAALPHVTGVDRDRFDPGFQRSAAVSAFRPFREFAQVQLPGPRAGPQVLRQNTCGPTSVVRNGAAASG